PGVVLPVKSTNSFIVLLIGTQESRVTGGNATSRLLGSDTVSSSRNPHGTPTFSFPFVRKNGILWENRSSSLDVPTSHRQFIISPFILLIVCCIMLQPSELNSEVGSIKTSYSSIISWHGIKVVIKYPYLINCKQIDIPALIKVKKFWVR
uniref:Uncharacterized protein n=1 Tax=Setaria italica TaxID=4555 RepID=K3XQL5_SETIT